MLKRNLISLISIFGIGLVLYSCSVSYLKPAANSGGDESQRVLAFYIDDKEGVISGSDITITLPVGTTNLNLAPVIALPTGSSISPSSGVIQDFSSPIQYTFTLADGTQKVYTVTVAVAPF